MYDHMSRNNKRLIAQLYDVSTLKVRGKKVHQFSRSEVILVSHDHFIVSWRHWTSNHKLQMTKSSYLSYIMYNPKNKDTLLSSTLKVELMKVCLFSLSQVIPVSYNHFVVSWRHQTCSCWSQNEKKLIYQLYEVWLKQVQSTQ